MGQREEEDLGQKCLPAFVDEHQWNVFQFLGFSRT